MTITAVFSLTPNKNEDVHPVHKNWMSSVSDQIAYLKYADLPNPINQTNLNGISQLIIDNALPKSDIYIFEKPKHLYYLPILKNQNPECEIIYIHASCRLLGSTRYPRDTWGWKWPIGVAERELDGQLLKQLIKKYVDGVISVSDSLRNQIEKISNIPVEIVHPYVGNYAKELLNLTYSSKSKRVTTLAENRPRKGTKLLIDAWKQLPPKYDNYELHIAGREQANRSVDDPNIIVHGFVDSIPEFLTNSALHIHPAYCDPFPVSTLESMMAGIPTAVSEYSGTNTIVENIDKNLILQPEVESVTQTIQHFLSLDLESRNQISEKGRQKSSEYQQATNQTDFESGYRSLIDSINN